MTSFDSGRLGALTGRPQSVWSFEFQDARGELAGYTDSDWLLEDSQEHERWRYLEETTHPQDVVSHQKNVTLSTGEAEPVAMVKMSGEMIGMTQLASDWGLAVKGKIFAESGAAWGIARREEEAGR